MKIINKYYHSTPKPNSNYIYPNHISACNLSEIQKGVEEGICALIGEEVDTPAPENGSHFYIQRKSNEVETQAEYFHVVDTACFRYFEEKQIVNIIILTTGS